MDTILPLRTRIEWPDRVRPVPVRTVALRINTLPPVVTDLLRRSLSISEGRVGSSMVDRGNGGGGGEWVTGVAGADVAEGRGLADLLYSNRTPSTSTKRTRLPESSNRPVQSAMCPRRPGSRVPRRLGSPRMRAGPVVSAARASETDQPWAIALRISLSSSPRSLSPRDPTASPRPRRCSRPIPRTRRSQFCLLSCWTFRGSASEAVKLSGEDPGRIFGSVPNRIDSSRSKRPFSS